MTNMMNKLQLIIYYVTEHGSISMTSNIKEALENAVPDFYFLGNGRSPWGPFFMYCARTMNEINGMIEDCDGIYDGEIWVCPATPQLWHAMETEENDLLYTILPEGRADIDIQATNGKREKIRLILNDPYKRAQLDSLVLKHYFRFPEMEDFRWLFEHDEAYANRWRQQALEYFYPEILEEFHIRPQPFTPACTQREENITQRV
jgi:hypothetical protein